MEIEKKKKTIDVFVVGNEEFTDKRKAEEYIELQNKNLKYEYYLVSYNPDLTEGRGHYNKLIIAVDRFPGVNSVYQHLLKHFGEPVALVQGASPMPNYIVSEKHTFDNHEDLNNFLDEKRYLGIGYNSRKKVQVRSIILNQKGEFRSVIREGAIAPS